MTEGTFHKNGIYFGLPEDEYHADPALGSTSIKMLCQKPWMWQREQLRGREHGNITEPMKFGAAFHCYILEGPQVFEERYAIKPKPEEFGVPGKDILVTNDHLKDWLAGRGLTTTGNKHTLISRILDHANSGKCDIPILFDSILTRWTEKNCVDNGYALDSRQMQEIRDGIYQMRQSQIIKPIMDAHSLMGGAGEVSVFYEHEGVRCKNRYDYQLPSGEGRDFSMLLDLKVFSNFRGADPESAAMDTIYRMGYDLQSVHYMRGFECARDLALSGQVFGDPPSPDYVERLFLAEKVRWAWIMLKRDDGFAPVIPWIQRDDSYWSDPAWQNAEQAVDRAFKNYMEYVSKYGVEQLWPAPANVPPRVSYDCLPSYNRGF